MYCHPKTTISLCSTCVQNSTTVALAVQEMIKIPKLKSCCEHDYAHLGDNLSP